jgi:sphingosine kinase
MIADIDIESEMIRFMGILRNDLWAVWRLINLRSYKATFSYLPVDKVNHVTNRFDEDYPQFHADIPSNWVTVQGDFILFWASQVTHASVTTFQSPHSKLQDGVFNILVVRKPCSRWELLNILLGFDSGLHVINPKAEMYQCVSYRLDPLTEGSFNDIDGEVVEPGRIQGYVIPSAIKFYT